MSLFIASINSGSNGNCYYVGNENEAVLIDAGISCREFEIRMARLQLPVEKVKAIFVSHEHSDHIFGIPVISKKYKLPVYITPATLTNGKLKLEDGLCFSFAAQNPVTIGGLKITAFTKLHDACDPHSFTVEGNGVKIGIFTDLGIACDNLTNAFHGCHAAFLEANYDEEMLANGRYPYYLKNRIRGGHGHLSNKQAVELFIKCRHEQLSHLFLSHLSKDNNSPEIAEALFKQHAGKTEIIVASRFKETNIYEIKGAPLKQTVATILKQKFTANKKQQLSLF